MDDSSSERESVNPAASSTPCWWRSRLGLPSSSLEGRLEQPPIRHDLGVLLCLLLLVQVASGVLLLVYYRPGIDAWLTVSRITNQVQFGWLVRGLHRYASHAMIAVALMHLLATLRAQAYRAPRELTWAAGAALGAGVVLSALSGYVLMADQQSAAMTAIAGEMLRSLPVAGHYLARVICPNPPNGSETVQRWFALHVGLLPMLMVGATLAHLWLVRTHGLAEAPSEIRWRGGALTRRLMLAALLVGGIAIASALFPPSVSPPASAALASHLSPPWFARAMFVVLRGSMGRSSSLCVAWVLFGILPLVLAALPLCPRAQRHPNTLTTTVVAYLFAWAAMGLWGSGAASP